MPDDRYDLVVLGGGPGGYVAAIRAARLGLRCAVVDRGSWGGACLHWGCIPSKALIHAARLVGRIRAAAACGIRWGDGGAAPEPRIDLAAMMAWKDGIVRRMAAGVKGLLKAAGADAVVGEASLDGPHRVRVVQGGVERSLETRAVILATGSRPIELPELPFDGLRVIGAREALSLNAVPRRMVVVGGGAVGLELGGVWANLGANVTIVEMMPQVLPGADPDMARVVERRLARNGIEVLADAKVTAADTTGAATRLRVEGPKDDVREIDADIVLVCVGMRPNVENIGLERAGVKTDARGFVQVDDRLRTNVEGVFAVGDLTGPPLLAHRASRQGEVAAEVVAGRPSRYDSAAVPAAVYCDPEIAGVGVTETQAARDGRAVKVGRFPFAACGRAIVDGDTDGFVKVVADAAAGRVLGVHVVGPHASDLIAEGVLVVASGMHVRDLARTVHPHPTHAEAIMEAAKAAMGEAIHAVGATR